MPDYVHTQPGTLIRVMLGAMLIIFAGMALALTQFDPGAAPWLLVSVLMVALILALFHSLTVSVSQEEVRASFGVGLISKRFNLDDVASAEAVRNPWYYSWGIKKIPRGWQYNVSGFDTVELKMKNGRINRIGTDEPGALQAAIESALTSRDS